MEKLSEYELNRRSFLALLGGVLALAGTSSCRTRPRSRQLAEDARLAAIVDTLLPRTSTPGGLDTDVPRFVASMIEERLPTEAAAVVRAGLDAIDFTLQTLGHPDLASQPAPQRTRMIAWIDAAAFDPLDKDGAPLRPFWLLLKQLIVVGHFGSKAAVEAQLLYDPLPGAWQADVLRTAATRVSYIDRTGVPYLVTIPT